ncbi:hypothetical protein NPIL_378441, partial [Nephila pilipes]
GNESSDDEKDNQGIGIDGDDRFVVQDKYVLFLESV